MLSFLSEMMRFRDISIRKKLLLIIMGVNLLVLIPAFLFLMFYGFRVLEEEVKRQMGTAADIIGHNCIAALLFEDAADAANILRAFKADASILSACLFNQNGIPLAGYAREGSPCMVAPDKLRPDGFHVDNRSVSCFRSIYHEGSPIGTVAIHTDLGLMHALMKRAFFVVIAAFLVSFLCVFLLSLRLQRVIVDPVVRLAHMAGTISKDSDYSVRAVKGSNDEMGTLIDAFNDMLARLYGHQVQLEQMVKDRTAELERANEALCREIEERKAVEVKLRASLDEKSTLLGEVHHRVRNNLQVISSLLGLADRRTQNAEAHQVIEDTRCRIFAMAMIHSHLYRSGDFNHIDMKDHIHMLWNSIQQVNDPVKRNVIPVIHCEDIYLSLPQAIPCSLVLNEAITNVFKYAYEDGLGGPCHISMNRCGDHRICIRIRDEGRGIPEAVDADVADTLGLKLMRNLVCHQLQGEFRVERTGGTDIWIEFSLAHEDHITPEKSNTG